jgi:putative transposase
LTTRDNSPAESLFSTLQFELLAVRHFLTRAQARRAVAGWIEEYNQIRRHSTNGMLSPVAFESARARARDEAAA